MEKEKRVLPLLGTETMIVKDIEFNEEHTSQGALPRARVELEYWGHPLTKCSIRSTCVLHSQVPGRAMLLSCIKKVTLCIVAASCLWQLKIKQRNYLSTNKF